MIKARWPETDERITNIGSNGNTGEHYNGPADMTQLGFARDESPSDRQVGGSHYKKHSIQPWDIIDEYGLGFYEGNVLKYLLRDKGNKREDLEKAVHYLEKVLEDLE